MNSLVRYSPRGLDVFGNFDRMFDSMFRSNVSNVTTKPAVDIRESENGYVLEAELPGFAETEIDVKLNDTLLTISAGTEEKSEESKAGYLLRERRSRSFTRSFVLPREVDRESIEAAFSNGVLTLELHKTPEAQPRQIEVKKSK